MTDNIGVSIESVTVNNETFKVDERAKFDDDDLKKSSTRSGKRIFINIENGDETDYEVVMKALKACDGLSIDDLDKIIELKRKEK